MQYSFFLRNQDIRIDFRVVLIYHFCSIILILGKKIGIIN